MKVIFLDIDGVIVTEQCQLPKRLHPGHANCDARCVRALNRILSTTAAGIVVSSSWRTEWSVAELQEILNFHFGVAGQVLDCTPLLETTTPRSEEIAAWLQQTGPGTIESFAILDDAEDMGPLQSRLIKTVEAEGLTEPDADRAIALLSSNPS